MCCYSCHHVRSLRSCHWVYFSDFKGGNEKMVCILLLFIFFSLQLSTALSPNILQVGCAFFLPYNCIHMITFRMITFTLFFVILLEIWVLGCEQNHTNVIICNWMKSTTYCVHSTHLILFMRRHSGLLLCAILCCSFFVISFVSRLCHRVCCQISSRVMKKGVTEWHKQKTIFFFTNSAPWQSCLKHQ